MLSLSLAAGCLVTALYGALGYKGDSTWRKINDSPALFL